LYLVNVYILLTSTSSTILIKEASQVTVLTGPSISELCCIFQVL